MGEISNEVLLAEVSDILRTIPDIATIRHQTSEIQEWFGRASALIENWQPAKLVMIMSIMFDIHSIEARKAQSAVSSLIILLQQAKNDLRMKTTGPLNVAINRGAVFNYFDEIRKLIEVATKDLLFIDPYLDAEFVSRYLPLVKSSASIRLLTTEQRIKTLRPAVEAFAQQEDRRVQLRLSKGMHDRYIFIDNSSCYQSGASFKDGAVKSPTILAQITDAFKPMADTYNLMWDNAQVVM